MSTFWRNWLRGASILLILTGALTALIIIPALAGPTRAFAAAVFWPTDLTAQAFSPVATLALGISGAVMMGWGTTIYVVATHGQGESFHWVRRAIVGGLLVWFLVDNIVSITVGATLNVASNTVFALVFLLPFLASRQKQQVVA